MQFFTKFKSEALSLPMLDHHQKVMLLGSCFSENMTPFFKKCGFNVVTNPFGIVYNPESIAILILKMMENTPFSDQQVLQTADGYSAWLLHSAKKFESKAALNNWFLSQNEYFKEKQPKLFIITLGTAWVHYLQSNGQACANCHKQNANLFDKNLMDQSAVNKALNSINQALIGANPNNKIIYTLSPVRHIKDGFIENMQSKAILHQSIMQSIDNQKVYYFPAFEIMMDELRDYRFYNEDLLHPNQTAIKVIWEYFYNWCMNEDTKKLANDLWGFNQLKNHKLLHKSQENSDKHQEKMKEIFQKITNDYSDFELNFNLNE